MNAPGNTLCLRGITSFTQYDNGNLRECRVDRRNVISMPCGDLVPHFSRPDVRSKDLKSLSFYEGGAIRSVSLDEQTEVTTPIGRFPAELVTFYEDGVLDSIFPLNGQIGFTWSEEDEKKLADTFSFEFGFGTITAKIIGVRFYHGGAVKSIILWPGEVVPLDTPAGRFGARTGVRLFDTGQLQSFEPAVPIDLPTPIGRVQAYDLNALTIDADENSVRFDPDGNLVHAVTSGDVIVSGPVFGHLRISSRTRMALSRDEPVKLPIDISFGPDRAVVANGVESHEFVISQCRFLVLPDIDTLGLSCSVTCDECAIGCA